jgi:prevent-host-death family protein
MQTVSIRELKSNPSVALRQAVDDVVVVTNRDTPQAVLVDLAQLGMPDLDGVKTALAVSLFKQGTVSLGYAARMADKTKSQMISLLSAMQIPIVHLTPAELENDLQTARRFAL